MESLFIGDAYAINNFTLCQTCTFVVNIMHLLKDFKCCSVDDKLSKSKEIYDKTIFEYFHFKRMPCSVQEVKLPRQAGQKDSVRRVGLFSQDCICVLHIFIGIGPHYCHVVSARGCICHGNCSVYCQNQTLKALIDFINFLLAVCDWLLGCTGSDTRKYYRNMT